MSSFFFYFFIMVRLSVCLRDLTNFISFFRLMVNPMLRVYKWDLKFKKNKNFDKFEELFVPMDVFRDI